MARKSNSRSPHKSTAEAQRMLRRESFMIAVKRFYKVGLAVVLLAACPQALPQQKKYTLDDYMQISSVGSFVWAPDGGTLYYTNSAGDSGTDEIFRIAASGGMPQQLSKNPPGVRPDPKEDILISPDGRFLFYTSAHLFQNIVNIWRMPVSGGVGTALTFNDAIIETAPSISPDGKQLAYFTRTGTGTKIYLLDLDAERAWPRLFDPASRPGERFPSWSPDGKKIGFQREG